MKVHRKQKRNNMTKRRRGEKGGGEKGRQVQKKNPVRIKNYFWSLGLGLGLGLSLTLGRHRFRVNKKLDSFNSLRGGR